MGSISRTDVMFATVTRSGDTLYNGRLSGVASMADVIALLHKSLSGVGGMLTLNLRNGSQGWSARTSFMLVPAEGTQLTLF